MPEDAVQVMGVDPALVDASGDPQRKHPEAHAAVPPPFLVSEGKATMQDTYLSDETYDDTPTDEELKTLERVSAGIDWRIYTIAFVELVERMSWYGVTALISNFIAKARPTPTGAALDPNDEEAQPGGLGLGKQIAFNITTFNTFWTYVMPLFGAYVADTYFGRFKTIFLSVIVAEIGHTILTVSTIPKVMDNASGSLGCFMVGLVIMGVGTGGFKPNISPLIAEQVLEDRMRVTEVNGKRVIIDPGITITRIYNYFYMFINIGALVGQLTMAYAERYVGFWLAFLLPTIMFFLAFPVLIYCKPRYTLLPPSGSVMAPAMKLFFKALGNGISPNPVKTVKRWQDGQFWNRVKPSTLGASAPSWYTFDDAWVDEVARGLTACGVFVWVPVYWLAYRQMDSNLIQMCSTMKLGGVPNDVLNNFDPLAIVILVPIVDLVVYPALRRRGINFSPIKKITAGFLFGAAAMVWAAVLQHYIYKTSGYYDADPKPEEYKSPITVWAVIGVYILVAISEIFASVTTLEYAFTKAPKNMRSLVQSVQLFTTAFSAALQQAFTPLTADPYLVWNYGSVAIIAGVVGIAFHFFWRSTDRDEERMNLLPTGHLGTQSQAQDVERRLSAAGDRKASLTGPTELNAEREPVEKI
ncbi:unnamed protein product [Periconia digitata]|uniref:Peptide transporter PTR2-A n=1 Tax=Periconia digitata TaxID=1303443 RepID=A0A9W4U4Y9_9PLEO|nr:unnamed protein product [Periconia digitata]